MIPSFYEWEAQVSHSIQTQEFLNMASYNLEGSTIGHNFRLLLEQVWARLEELVLEANTPIRISSH